MGAMLVLHGVKRRYALHGIVIKVRTLYNQFQIWSLEHSSEAGPVKLTPYMSYLNIAQAFVKTKGS